MTAVKRSQKETLYLHYESLDSTNQEAFRQMAQGIPSGTWLVADKQTAGRGRQGRTWHSLSGNLFASLYFRTLRPLADLPLLSFAAGLAAHAAITQVSAVGLVDADLCLKWPNDLLLNGGKVCGILVESRQASTVDRTCHDIVIGTGINIVGCPAPEPRFPATSLAEHGMQVHRDEVLRALAATTERWLEVWQAADGRATICDEWMKRACHVGCEIEITNGSDVARGRFSGIDETGALVLWQADGVERKFASGHLSLVGANAEFGTTR